MHQSDQILGREGGSQFCNATVQFGLTGNQPFERCEAFLAGKFFIAHDGDDLPSPGLYQRVLREVEQPLITLTLQATRGNQIRAAEILGLNRNTLRKKIRDLNIPVVKGAK